MSELDAHRRMQHTKAAEPVVSIDLYLLLGHLQQTSGYVSTYATLSGEALMGNKHMIVATGLHPNTVA